MSKRQEKEIVLGSCKVFAKVYAGTQPTLEEMKIEANLLGLIKGGASIVYKPTYYEAKDDLGLQSKQALTEEEATVKCGVMTWNGKTINTLTDTGRVSEKDGIRNVKIGGINNQKREKYCILLYHEDKVDGDVWVFVVGNNQAGFELSFAKDKETVIDAEIKCSAMDGEGTLIDYNEQIETIAA